MFQISWSSTWTWTWRWRWRCRWIAHRHHLGVGGIKQVHIYNVCATATNQTWFLAYSYDGVHWCTRYQLYLGIGLQRSVSCGVHQFRLSLYCIVMSYIVLKCFILSLLPPHTCATKSCRCSQHLRELNQWINCYSILCYWEISKSQQSQLALNHWMYCSAE